MPYRPRPLLAVLLAAVLSLALAACGGSGDAADSATDVDTLLQETFAGDKRVESGRLDLALRVDPRGLGGDEPTGPLAISLRGPFATEGEGKLPRFDLDATFDGMGQTLRAGVTSTGDAGYVTFQGQDYELSSPLFRQFRAAFEQAQSQGRQSGEPSLSALGIDPRRWVTDARNEGETKVGDDATIKITGGVDVDALLADVDRALAQAGELGASAGDLPERLTDAQKREIRAGVENPRVEIHTGVEDKILRRLVVTAGVRDPETAPGGAAAVRLDLSVTDVNAEQRIEAPSDPRPFSELAGSLGALGGFGGGAGSAGNGDGAAGASSGASSKDLERYSECVTEAGSDSAEARRCAELLTR